MPSPHRFVASPRPKLSLLLVAAALSLIPAAPGQESAAKEAKEKESAKKSWSVSEPGVPLRDLSFSVDEGTWLSCDVSPDGKQIVFDLLGDLYVLPIDGGTARCLRRGLSWDIQPRWSPDGSKIAFTSDADGGDNLWVMEADGSEARAVSKERFRLLNNPGWTPDGRFLVGRKHFTARRSLGSGEMWLYPLGGGPGIQLTKRKNDQQDAGEPCFSADGNKLYWSEDVSPGPTFEYNKDPNGEIYVIFEKDLETGKRRRLVTGNGGAFRPQPSPDGKQLAFVRRVREKTVLFVRDLASGRDRPVFDGLSRDTQETWSIFGVYPGFDWTPDSRDIVIWAKGHLHRVSVATGEAAALPMKVDVAMTVAETLRRPEDIGREQFETLACRWPAISPDGRRVAWQALGRIWVRDLAGGEAAAWSPEGHFAHTPAWSPDGRWLAFTTWHDQALGRVMIARPGEVRTVVETPGHYLEPAWSPDGRWIVYRRLGGDTLRGRRATQEAGIWRVPVAGGPPLAVTRQGERPRFDGTGRRILLERRDGGDRVLVSVNPAGWNPREIARSKDATEFAVSPDGRWLAFTELWNAYVCPLPRTGKALRVSPAMKTVPVRRLSKDAGRDLAFSPDSRTVSFGLARHVHRLAVETLFSPPFGTRETKGELPRHFEEFGERFDLAQEVPTARHEGCVALVGARVVTMRGREVIEGGAILVKGDRIAWVGSAENLEPPAGCTVIDLAGHTIVPGFVDAHAHIRHGSSGILPQRNWQHLANLSFGVTTTHDPSNDTATTFAAAELQRAGAIVAPRIFSTGTILYGAGGDFRAVIDSYEDALSHIRRTAAYGAFTVKSYNQPRRDQRQQVMKAARELGIMVVPEGGSTLQHNLTHIVDGHTTLEHALPVAPLHEDVLTLFARSGTAYTPTLIVGYGGLWGENYWYQKTEVWKNRRLLRHMPSALLDARSRRRTMAPDDDFNHIDLARGAAELARRGTLVEVGAHGQIQGLGVHWEMWMFEQGGMTPHEALMAGTVWPAKALGLDGHVGSLGAGKLADLAVIRGNPLEDLRCSEEVAYVMLGGRLRQGETLEELWPQRRPLAAGPSLDDLEPATGPAAGLCGCLPGGSPHGR